MVMNQWQRVTVSRIEKVVYLYLEGVEGSSALADGQEVQLSLSQFLWVGGLKDVSLLPDNLPVSSQFHGCIQKVAFFNGSF